MTKETLIVAAIAAAVAGLLLSRGGGGGSLMERLTPITSRITGSSSSHKIIIGAMVVAVAAYLISRGGSSKKAATQKAAEGALRQRVGEPAPADLETFDTTGRVAYEKEQDDAVPVAGNFLTANDKTNNQNEAPMTQPTMSALISLTDKDPARHMAQTSISKRFASKDLREPMPVTMNSAQSFPFALSSEAAYAAETLQAPVA